MLKLIFLLYRVDLGLKLSENDGVQMFRPLDPPLRGGPFPRIDSAPISANNEPIFTIFLWISDDAESNCETLEVPRSDYNRFPVTIDIGHQSQGHYYGSDEPSHIVSLSMVFWAR